MAAGFSLHELAGPPAQLVAPASPADGARVALLARPRHPALVLGSAQPESDADRRACAELGWEVVRRQSGGGAVPVAPGAQVWLDLFLPPGDPRFEQDVSRAGWWLGELWVAALRSAGLGGELSVHKGPLEGGRWARLACFSGLGPGEVSWEGRKLVGCSQRRGRWGGFLHTMVLLEPGGHARLPRLLALDPAGRVSLASELATKAAALPVAGEQLERALAEELAQA